MPKTPTAKCRVAQRRHKRRQVWEDCAKKTGGGLTRADLKQTKSGRIVSRKKSAAAAAQNNVGLVAWRQALRKACENFGVSYQIPKKDTELYKEAKAIMNNTKKPTKKEPTKKPTRTTTKRSTRSTNKK